MEVNKDEGRKEEDGRGKEGWNRKRMKGVEAGKKGLKGRRRRRGKE